MLNNTNKIKILFKEYDMLRQEVVNRINNRFLMLGATGSFLCFTVFTDNTLLQSKFFDFSIRNIILISGCIILLAIWLWFGHLIKIITGRISEIE